MWVWLLMEIILPVVSGRPVRRPADAGRAGALITADPELVLLSCVCVAGSENNSLYLYYKGLSKTLLTFKFDTVKSVLDKDKKEDDTNEFVSAVCWRALPDGVSSPPNWDIRSKAKGHHRRQVSGAVFLWRAGGSS